VLIEVVPCAKDVTAVFERRPYRFLAGALLFIQSKLTLLAFFLNCQLHDASAELIFVSAGMNARTGANWIELNPSGQRAFEDR